MTVTTFSLKPFKYDYRTPEMTTLIHDVIQSHLQRSIFSLAETEVYSMRNSATKLYKAGAKNRLLIFIGADVPETDETLVNINDGMAYYYNRFNELYIPSDVTEFNLESAKDFLDELMTLFVTDILDKKGLESSWKLSPIRDQLVEKFKARIRNTQERTLNNDKQRVQQWEEHIDSMQREAKQLHDNIIATNKRIEIAESTVNDAEKKVTSELDLIADHPRVKDLHIKDNKIVAYVDDIVARTKRDKYYYIGNFRIEMNLDNSDVRFFGDNARRSHWTQNDPHPHVNGRNGQACLGSVSQTIAELCSYNEIYALFLTCLDFLENANIEDTAGKNVVRWEEVNKDGKKLGIAPVHNDAPIRDEELDPDESFTCEHCEELAPDDEYRSVYTRIDSDEGDLRGEEGWCESCVERDATFDDHHEEYVTDELWAELDEARNEEDEAV